ncbi:hypothetical protein BKA69DRAFT_1073479 [Paraphysoderma sedebokerense]|nr:hypothetical protein BKA69DRAFT_1073479 [Paraphysoderma sedebokerense]
MKKTLRTLFEPYGDILDIIAAPTLKKRGQAFVVFEDVSSAKKAIKELQYYPLYNKPMIIQYAKRKSDAIAALDGTLEDQKRRRLEERERRKQEKAHAVTQQPQLPFFPTPFPGMPGIPPMPLPNATELPQLPLPNVPAPDLLVPNSILFIENLPSGATDIENLLVSLFNQYPGFKSVRLVPTKSDIAFVEFENEMFSAIARGALHGYKLLDVEIKVTFAKK